MRLKLIAAKKTDVGKQREQNEDNAFQRIESLEDGDYGLFIVADGMGGYKAGEVASQLAVDEMSKALEPFFKPRFDQTTVKLDTKDVQTQTTQSDDPDATIQLSASAIKEAQKNSQEEDAAQKTIKLSDSIDVAAREQQLKKAIEQANRAIVQYGENQSAARGLGCTVTAALIEGDKAYVANVGDSRTYLLRDKILKPITRDHSLVARLVESNQIEQDDVYTHPQRNLIYRSLGAGHKNVEVDTFLEILKPGDMLLLCSDGLWEMVRDAELQKVLVEQRDPQQICNTLIHLANKHGGEDNITAIVVQVSTY